MEVMSPNLNFKPLSTTMQCILNLTLQYFIIYPSFFVSIIVNQFINMEILCCVMPIFEAAWMTVMFAPMPSRIFRVREGAASRVAARSP